MGIFALQEQLSARACRHADQKPSPVADAARMGSSWLVVLTSGRARPVLRLTHMPKIVRIAGA